MSDTDGIILGFDPGGRGNFGWSICETTSGKLKKPRETGLANDAWHAMEQVKKALTDDDTVLAAGIDAPLFWSKRGNRTVDGDLRESLRGSCQKIRVLAVNSLWGSVLVQGLLLAKHIRKEWKDVKITEAHPTALCCLVRNSGQPELEEMVDHVTTNLAGDVRDATLSAVAAWAMLHKPCGWSDLSLKEQRRVQLIDPPVSYWMPIPSSSSKSPAAGR